MAPESLTDGMVCTNKSDVWSYGIVLWEMFSLGKAPYPGVNVKKLVPRLLEGYRMEAPPFASDHMWDTLY